MGNLNVGMPGIDAAITSTQRSIFQSANGIQYMPVYATIEGSECRDAGNTNDIDTLRAGYLLSKDVSGTGKYVGTIIGVTTAVITGAGTTLTVSAATATEALRRYGSSGSAEMYLIGDTDDFSDEETTVIVNDIIHSAIGATTITITALGSTYPAGSLIVANEAVRSPADGTLNPTMILTEAVKVTNRLNASVDVPFRQLLIAGSINTDRIVDYPSNAGLRVWLKNELRDDAIGLSFAEDF